MITQDACSFYNDIALGPEFSGVVAQESEGAKIAELLGKNKATILRNHGILLVFLSLFVLIISS